jgi:hypothetical protein
MIGLEVLGAPPATAKLLTWFARHPTARPTVREIQRTLGIASASAQRDLDRLVRARALHVVVDGRLRRYAPVIDSGLWAAIRILLADEPAPKPPQVREAAVAYGVDLTQLDSMLRLTVEERLRQLDANAAFVRAIEPVSK